jgi:hypothetical protein
MGLTLRGWLVLIGVLGLVAAMATLSGSSARPYPECDDGKATATLALLYDNRHLLHAVEVTGIHHLRDGFNARFCSAVVKWQNGTDTDVAYEFDRSRSGGQNYMSMWVNWNGGQRGPSF